MSSRREKLLQKINPKFLENTPKLSVTKDSIIDLDSGKDTLKKGTKDLMLRFFRNQELLFKSISTKDGIEITDTNHLESYRFCQSISERLSLPFASKNEFQLDRPGKKFQDLKKKLEEKMSAERKEQYQKRVSEYNKWKNDQKEKEFKEASIDELEEEFSESEKDSDNENSGNDNDENSNGLICNDKNDPSESSNIQSCEAARYDAIKANSNSCTDGMNSNSSDKNVHAVSHNNLDEEENGDSDSISLIPPYQAGGEMMFSGLEQTQCTQDLPLDLLTPSLAFNLNESQSFKNFSDNSFQEGVTEKKTSSRLDSSKIFLGSQNSNSSFDLADAFEFCSGKFPDESELRKPNLSNKEVLNDSTKDDSPITESDEKLEDNVDSEKINGRNSSKCKKRIIAFEESDEESDFNLEEEEDDDDDEEEKEKDLHESKIVLNDENDFDENLKLKSRGARHILNFSDEEDEPNDEEGVGARSEDEDEDGGEDKGDEGGGGEDEDEDEEEEDVDQRSVHYDSEENEIINPREFFEKEAELSGSEWSGDEDERGLDEFDEEAGDAEELDYNKIQSQLGKIHLRRILDDDSNNVRLLQELFFEDGDLHADSEYKKFKWRNLTKVQEKETESIVSETIEEKADSSDEEFDEDLKSRKERLEKQLTFEKMKKNGELITANDDDDFFKSVFRKLKVVASFKNRLRTSGGSEEKSECYDKSRNLFGAEDISVSERPGNSRGSFLTRNEEFLSRLAKFASSLAENVRSSKNPKNFVFATRSPEEVKSDVDKSKRKLDSTENVRSRKKLKLVPVPNRDSIPSILDLLG